MLSFEIPVQREDLLGESNNNNNKYRIESLQWLDNLSENQMMKELDRVYNEIKNDGKMIETNSRNFEALFGCLRKFSTLETNIQERLYEVLAKGLTSIGQSAGNLLASEEPQEGDEANEQANIYNSFKNSIKMWMFLLDWFVFSTLKASIEQQKNAKNVLAAPAPKGKGKSKKTTSESAVSLWDSETEKETMLTSINTLIELEISIFWRSTRPEETVLSLFSNVALNFIENPANLKNKAIKKCLFMIFATLIKKYNQSIQVVTGLVHLLQTVSEPKFPVVLAELLEYFAREHKILKLVGEFIREISKIGVGNDAKKTEQERRVKEFIEKLGQLLPDIIYENNYTITLVNLLDGPAHLVRDGVVSTLGFIVEKVFAKETDESRLNGREDLLDILQQRVLDRDSHSRAHVLSVWSELYGNQVVPLSRLDAVMEFAIGRLKDTTSTVRKAAIDLVRTILQHNPFGPVLRLSEFQARLVQVNKQIEEHKRKQAPQEQNKEESMEVDEQNKQDEELPKKLKNEQTFLSHAVRFITKVHESIPVVIQILGCTTEGDVKEAIDFFKTAKQFQIENADEGTKRTLYLIFYKGSQDKANIKKALRESFQELYLNEKQNPLQNARSLSKLTIDATLGELTCLQEMLIELMKEKLIEDAVVQHLWDLFAAKNKKIDVTPQESRGALINLSFLAQTDPSIVKNRVNLLVQVGLGERAKEDEFLAKYTCICLQRLSVPDTKDAAPIRFKSNHMIFTKLAELIKDRSSIPAKWYPGAEQAINTIYLLCEKPDTLCEEIIKTMANEIFIDKNMHDPEILKQCSVSDLSKFFFILGHVALKQLTYIQDVQAEFRRRRTTSNDKKSKDKEKTAIELELGEKEAEDHEVELREKQAEKDIGKNLVGMFGPVIALVCANSGSNFTDHSLRSAATLSLCKLMCTSAEFCESHLRLIFTILETAPESNVRANIVIAIGDLVARHTNLMEPYTGLIYARLRDSDPRVRKNTLMMLSHLILNGMIKIRGQIGDMAVCVEDTDERISNLAKLFFSELARKEKGPSEGNANNFYNALPDVISHLNASSTLNPNSFKNIVRYLFSFVEKEKQTENLLALLCSRFKTTTEPRQWRNLAYCLTLLNFANEKMPKKMKELASFYIEAIRDTEVRQHFLTIAGKIKKTKTDNKDEKDFLQELEEAIIAASDGKPIESLAATKPAKPVAKRRAPAGSSRGKRGGGGRKKVEKYESEEEEEADFSEEESESSQQAPPPKSKAAPASTSKARPARVSRAKKTSKQQNDSEDEIMMELDEQEEEEKPKKGKKRKIVDSDEE